jgi:NitT/TauT family transport system substrate-binding protein
MCSPFSSGIVWRRLYALTAAFGFLAMVSAQSANSQQLTNLRLVIGSSDTSADGYFAYEAGFFKKNGLNVEIVQSKGGAASAAAVAGNAADVGDANIITLANARSHGIPFVMIAPGYFYDAADPYVVLAVSRTSTFKTAKDLNGQIIGEPSLGGMAEAAIGAWIDQNGGDLKSIKYVEVPPSESVPALDQGRIAAVVFQDPQLSEQRDRVRILSQAYDAVAKKYLNTAWFTTADWAAKNPDALKRFRLAISEAADWADKNPDLAKQALGKWLKTHITKIRHFHADTIDAAMMQPFLDAAKKYGILQRPVSASDLIYPPSK